MKKRRVVIILAIAYPVALLCAALALRFGGERWWITGVGLYLPRAGFAVPLPLLTVALLALGLRRYLWTQAPAALLVLFVLMGLTLPWPTGGDARAPKVRVLSYNVNSSAAGVDDVVQAIERYSPDVVLLQEIGVAPEELASAMRAHYASVTVKDQFLLASRHPVVSSFDPDKLPIRGKMRSAQWIEQRIETPIGRVAFYDVHPESPRWAFHRMRGQGLRRELLSGHFFSEENADVFSRNAELREAQIESLTRHAADEDIPVVIGGDTNLPELSWVLRRHLLSSYQDGFSRAGSGFGYTFPAKRPWMRIDRIFASHDLRFVRFEVGDARASDHFCVVADLQRAN